MELDQIVTAVNGLRAALDLFKGIRDELKKKTAPQKGIDEQIARAETALKAGEAQLAKALGYRLCQCVFPPEIMLRDKNRGQSVCPRCGDAYPPPPRNPRVIRSPALDARRR